MQYLLFLVLLALTPLSSMAEAVDFDRQAITIALLQEPPNLDTTRTTDLVSFFVIGHVGEGLVRYDRRGQLSPGVAVSWETQPDRIVFHLRDDAHWSDGSRITAHDFVYAWRYINNPANAAPYAAIMYPVMNAERVQKGELPVERLGVSAADDATLVVELESPCGYCISLMVHAAFYPVKQSFRESSGENYGSEPEHLLYNGPFELTEWVHGSRLLMRKNPDYWDRDAITLNEIHVGYITEDNRTRLNLFRDEQIALARLGAETVKDAVNQGMRLRTFVSGGLAFLRFNMNEGHFTRDPRVRKAIQLVFDADEFVNKVIAVPGYKPAYSFFPGWVTGVEDRFGVEYPVRKPPIDLVAARRLVGDATKEYDGDPSLKLLTVTSPTGARIAEYFQGLLKQRLGIDVKVDQQIFKLYLDKSRNRDFDLALSSWYPDFDDVVTYADLLASWNANNRGDYSNPAYDSKLQLVLRASDAKTRMDAASALQQIIIDDVPVLPMAETGSAYLQHPRLRGVVRRVLGADPDYTYARIVR